ncbi:hypothetical protein QLX08_000927 [Tetragonisca angustula]|uniref:Uncharacterized protein n=1 Tax=Tetragonisca angustula TaxID=166442 RepID=A0AAW1AKW1_9HYME
MAVGSTIVYHRNPTHDCGSCTFSTSTRRPTTNERFRFLENNRNFVREIHGDANLQFLAFASNRILSSDYDSAEFLWRIFEDWCKIRVPLMRIKVFAKILDQKSWTDTRGDKSRLKVSRRSSAERVRHVPGVVTSLSSGTGAAHCLRLHLVTSRPAFPYDHVRISLLGSS